jgi:SRSO17 transposase
MEMVPPDSVTVARPASWPVVWPEAFAELFAMVAGEFAQAPSRRRARGYLLGLLSHGERKNGWTIAEFAGDAGPAGMQRLLNFYAWDEDRVRDGVRRYVVKAFGDPSGVLVADETGFLKKGKMSAGVQRQYSGTAGRVENCQLGVFLAYAAPGGERALTGRELYLPESWTGDRERCREAGVGDGVAFATKPELAREMLERAVTAGVPFSWFTADEAYGQNPGLRDWLEEQQISCVMAVPVSEPCVTRAGKFRADQMAARVPAGGWQVLSCGDGSKGPRLYDWALISLVGPGRHLLVRRALTANAKGELELAYFLCYAPPGATLAELVAVAGARRAVEDCFAGAKNETGLDHYQVRRYRAWNRHITLSMLAHAFLAVTAAANRAQAPPPAPGQAPEGTAKKGTAGLRTNIQPAENIQPARTDNRA